MTLSRDNPMRRVLAALLVFEVIVFALAAVGMVAVGDATRPTASALGAGSCALALLAAATLRGRPGLPLGWLTQAVGIGLGFVTPLMFVMGGLFAVLWGVAFVLGRRLDASR